MNTIYIILAVAIYLCGVYVVAMVGTHAINRTKKNITTWQLLGFLGVALLSWSVFIYLIGEFIVKMIWGKIR